MFIRRESSKGVGGFYNCESHHKMTPDVKLIKTATAKEGKKLEKMVVDETEDSLKNLNNDVLSGNELQQAVASETVKVEPSETKKRKAKPDTPKRQKNKISSMKKFKPNYFD